MNVAVAVGVFVACLCCLWIGFCCGVVYGRLTATSNDPFSDHLH
jgi:hypothetical protein